MKAFLEALPTEDLIEIRDALLETDPTEELIEIRNALWRAEGDRIVQEEMDEKSQEQFLERKWMEDLIRECSEGISEYALKRPKLNNSLQ